MQVCAEAPAQLFESIGAFHLALREDETLWSQVLDHRRWRRHHRRWLRLVEAVMHGDCGSPRLLRLLEQEPRRDSTGSRRAKLDAIRQHERLDQPWSSISEDLLPA